MHHYVRALCASAILLAACTTTTTVARAPAPSPAASKSPSTAVTLGVPPGQLPPVGRCRVWVPGQPPGHQPRARSCNGIVATAPAGSWILFRPRAEKGLVQVRYVNASKAGAIVRVRVFEAASGKFVRDERRGGEGEHH